MLSRFEQIPNRARDALILVALTLLAFVVFLQNAPFTRALSPDPSTLAALALVAARPFGIDDVSAMRLLFIALAVSAVLLIYLFARDAFHSRAVGWFSALALTSIGFLGARAATGPEPKLVVLVFGIATCWAIQKRAAWWAGICAALAFLAWQIAGIYLGVAILALWLGAKPKTRWQQAGRVLAGFLLTLAPFVLYLAATGALYDAWAQTILGNFNFLREIAEGTGGIGLNIGQNLTKFGTATWRCMAKERALLLLGGAGAVSFTLQALIPLRRDKWSSAAWGALALSASALGFAAISLIDFQNCPDLLPFFTILALGCGWLITRIVEWVTLLVVRAAPKTAAWAPRALFTLATLVLLLYGTGDSLFTSSVSRLRAPQEKIAARVEQELQPGDTIQQYGDSIVLVLTGRTNATPVLHLGPKQHQGIFFMYENGLDGYIAYLDAHKPRVITLGRRKQEAWAKKLYTWIETNYRLVDSFDAKEGGTVNEIDLYVRNQ
ncbi:MAG: hypothetical protein HY741_28485 [Chloroflexi bacterium]|nr:hypothetical protein [Chloroflexota bacterium]